jgi:hypothetical protein
VVCADPAFVAMLCLLGILVALTGTKIRTIDDAFGVKRELIAEGVLGLIHFSFWFSWVLSSPERDGSLFLHAYSFAFLTGLFYALFGIPLRRIYCWCERDAYDLRNLAVPSEIDCFAKLLASKPGRTSFVQHLVSRINVVVLRGICCCCCCCCCD